MTNAQVEREWRQKEREAALKKNKDDQELKEARLKQIEGRRRNIAVEIQRENDEFNKIIKLNIEDNEKLKEIEKQNKIVFFYCSDANNVSYKD